MKTDIAIDKELRIEHRLRVLRRMFQLKGG
jgi:hypothetical protein